MFITVSLLAENVTKLKFESSNMFLSPFLQPLKDIAVVSGQTARFECIVQCDPHPNVFWTKNGQVIENDLKYQIEFRNGVCRMTIPQSYQGLIFYLIRKFNYFNISTSIFR
jgi:Immunoglobulin I-set domain